MNRLKLPILCLVAFSTGCAIDPPQQKSGVTQGCAGSAKNSPVCSPQGQTQTGAGDSSAGNGNGGIPVTGQPPLPSNPAASLPSNPSATNPTVPTTTTDPFGPLIGKIGESIIGAITNGGSSGGSSSGSSTPTPMPTSSTGSSTPSSSTGATTTQSPSGGSTPSTTASVTLTTTAGVYFKKSYNTSTSAPSPDFCLVGYGRAISASCVSAYTDTVYYVTGANACSGFTSGYIFKSSVSVSGTISSQCR